MIWTRLSCGKTINGPKRRRLKWSAVYNISFLSSSFVLPHFYRVNGDQPISPVSSGLSQLMDPASYTIGLCQLSWQLFNKLVCCQLWFIKSFGPANTCWDTFSPISKYTFCIWVRLSKIQSALSAPHISNCSYCRTYCIIIQAIQSVKRAC